MSNNGDEYLNRIFYDPDNAASFSGVSKLYRQARKDDQNISKANIKKWLEGQKLYTLNRHSVSRFPRRKTIVPHSLYMYDADNAFMKDYVDSNEGNAYFLLAIDDFSRRVFTRPLKQLTGKSVTDALKSIFEESGKIPTILRSDKGTEFVNGSVKNYLKRKGIKHIVTYNNTKAAFAERAIYTIKRRLMQAMIANKSKRWLELLPRITKSYNESYHRSIGMKPNEVTKNNETYIWNRIHRPREKKPKTLPKSAKPFQFSVGDNVKVTINPHPFNKGYNKRFSDENYQIVERSVKQGKEVYGLKDMANDRILGSWYPEELQRISTRDDEHYEVEKILKTRRFRGKKQHLVHWVGWDKKFDSWIDADTLT